jgi:uncharacterized membrane protein
MLRARCLDVAWGCSTRQPEMKRFWALDRLRALAVVLMVQGHTFTALLDPRAFSPSFARFHGLLHGLTAPAFLFGAGLAFGLATYGDYARHRRPGPEVRRRFLRYLSLIAIGYALQLPGASLWAAFHVQGAQLELVCRIGPLHLVALTLGLCQLAIFVVPTARLHACLSAGLGLLVLLSSEAVGRAGLSERLPLLLGALFDDAHGSQFPIFPWASFALFGVGLGAVLTERAGSQAEGTARFALQPGWFVLAGALMVGIAYLALASGLAPFHAHWFWRTSPSYFAFRLGLVLVALGLLSCPGEGRRSGNDGGSKRASPRASEALSAVLARRSLTAYVVHLLLLYGTPLTPNLVFRLGPTLSLSEVSAVCLLILAATLVITLLSDRLERRERQLAARYKRVGAVLVGLTLLVR